MTEMNDMNAQEGADTSDYAGQFVTFVVGDRHYGVDIMTIGEIKQWSPTTPLPYQPGYTRGVLNMRGTIIPVHDLRARFGGMLTEPDDTNVVVIAYIGGQSVGVLVDAVSDILTVKSSDIRDLPEGSAEMDKETISGLVATDDETMVALLDLTKLFPATAH
jgi:purine-binding chemotaxis protein CheW